MTKAELEKRNKELKLQINSLYDKVPLTREEIRELIKEEILNKLDVQMDTNKFKVEYDGSQIEYTEL